MFNRRLNCLTLVLAFAFCFSGCSQQEELIPVAGTVLIDGKPLPMGSIQFVPENGRPFASKIGVDGTFRLVKVSVDKGKDEGVLRGKYRIGIASAEVVDEGDGNVRRHVPMHYADFRTSDLEMEISEPQENLVIELTWEGFEETEEEEAENTAGTDHGKKGGHAAQSDSPEASTTEGSFQEAVDSDEGNSATAEPQGSKVAE